MSKENKSSKRGDKKEEPHQKYDRAFQALFEEFREDIGIESKKNYQLDEKWQYKRPDTIVLMKDDFDYTTLSDKTFPCLKEWNVIEFKSCKENLALEDIPKYIANGNLLSRQMLLYRRGAGLKSIKDYVTLIIVSSNSVSKNIILDFDRVKYRKGLYIFNGINCFPVYLIVIEELDVISSNYPLLLLGNIEKQEELWAQLIEKIKQEVNAADIEKLWKYMVFSVKKDVFNIREGELMKKIREVSEKNDSIDRLFDEQFLGRILSKKDDETLGKLIKERGDNFILKVLRDKGKDFIAGILAELEEDEITDILEKIRKTKK